MFLLAVCHGFKHHMFSEHGSRNFSSTAIQASASSKITFYMVILKVFPAKLLIESVCKIKY
jgi:hypothetical protein